MYSISGLARPWTVPCICSKSLSLNELAEFQLRIGVQKNQENIEKKCVGNVSHLQTRRFITLHTLHMGNRISPSILQQIILCKFKYICLTLLSCRMKTRRNLKGSVAQNQIGLKVVWMRIRKSDYSRNMNFPIFVQNKKEKNQ